MERLEKNPFLLYSLRVGKFLIDILVIAGILYLTWVPHWYHLLLILVAVSATHQLTELIVRGVVEAARMRVRNQRERLVTSTLTNPLATWLAQWPATGGSSIEKLQQVLRRVPETIRSLEARVAAKVAEWAPSQPTPTPPPLPMSALPRTPETA